MVLLLTMVPVVVVLQEKMLKHAVGREGNRSNAESGKRALEAVEAAETASVAPGLTLDLEVSRVRNGSGLVLNKVNLALGMDILPLPRVVGRRLGVSEELAHVEARDVGLLAIVAEDPVFASAGKGEVSLWFRSIGQK